MARYGNVEITDESYVPGGFSVEDYLIPGKPNIDWDSVGVSYAGGLSQPETEKEGRSFAGEEPDLSNVKTARKRRSGLENTMLGIADILRISASMPNVYGQSAIKPGSAYLGMSEEEANRRSKIRMEEDPEGYQIDMNRAKVLSQRALETSDPELRKKYGAAIKELLPDETQGLDDYTASTFFSNADNKLKLEQLKGYNKLQEIAARNAGNLDVAAANNASREFIAAEKVNAQKQMNELDNQIKQAIADGKNDVAIQLLNMKNEQSDYIHQLDNEAAFAREALKQAGATTRERMSQTGQNYRTEYAQNAATERSKYTADTRAKTSLAVAALRPVGTGSGSGATGGKLSKEERQANETVAYRIENFPEYIRQNQKNIDLIDSSISALEQNPGASDKLTYISQKYLGGVGVSSTTQNAYGQINQNITKIVQHIIKELNEAGATSSVFNSPEEQKTLIGTIKDPSAPYAERLAAFKQFKAQYEEYLRKEMDKTLWKAKKMGYPVQNIVGSYMQNNNAGQSVYFPELRKNTPATTSLGGAKVDGGMEW